MRLQKLQSSILSLAERQSASARAVAAVLGQMESMATLVPLGRTLLRPLQREFRARFVQANQSWDCLVPLQDWFQILSAPWLDSAHLRKSVPLVISDPTAQFFMDASMGWGTHFKDHTAQGMWSGEELKFHINDLEMKAVVLAFQSFAQDLPKGHILVLSDNTSVVSYLNRQGGTHVPELSRMAESLHRQAYALDIFLSAKHVSGEVNVLADLLSRSHTVVQTEWTITHRELSPIWERFGKPMVDLFATRFNHRLPLFVSPVQDERAYAVDALSLSWKGLNAYAFPPFPLLRRVLEKAREENPRLILIAPDWPAQTWYPDLLSLAKARLPLRVSQDLLVQPRSGIRHGNVAMLKLTAWLLSGPG